MPSLLERFHRLPGPPLEDLLVIRPGTMSDYHALSHFHYRAGRPATVTRVLAMEVRCGDLVIWRCRACQSPDPPIT
jgi:hypothetical protein